MIESSKYSVDTGGLKEGNGRERLPQPLFARIIGHIVSFIFHPLFIPTYVMLFLLYVHPLVFADLTPQMKFFRLANIILCTALLPGFFVFLMWRLKFVISSLQLKTQKERMIPYLAAMFFYFWSWYVFRNIHSPVEIQLFLLGAFLSVCAAWMLNIFTMVSMHTTAMGVLVTFFLILAFRDAAFYGAYLSIAILVAGLVTTARLIVSDHTSVEVYAGLIAGAIVQLAAVWFV